MSVYGMPGTKHISRCRDGYCIQRTENGQHKYYGHAKTLIIALMRLDWIKANGWRKYQHPYKYIWYSNDGRKLPYRVARDYGGDKVEYGAYSTFEEAKVNVELLESVGWDLDAWCEVVDERNDDGDIIWLNRRMY